MYTIRMVYHMTEKGVKALSNGSLYIAFSQVSLKQLNEEKKGLLSRCTENVIYPVVWHAV